jgi:hypothetical protein
MPELKRTNIYLTERQYTEFARLGLEVGITSSELIRRALDSYLVLHQREKRWHLPSKELIVDAAGFVHATLTGIWPEELYFDDYDVHRLAWTFTPAQRGKGPGISHPLWTGRVFEYHPLAAGGYVNEEELRPNIFARLLLALGVVTEEDARHQRAMAVLDTFDLMSLIGTRVMYRLGTVYDAFAPPPDGYDPAFHAGDPPFYALSQGPDIDTLRLDPSPPAVPERSEHAHDQ